MRMKMLLSVLLCLAFMQARAQEEALPDAPLTEDVLSFENDLNLSEELESSATTEQKKEKQAEKKTEEKPPAPVVESAPQEPPFTQNQDEFEDALVQEDSQRDPVQEAPVIEEKPRPALRRAERPAPKKGVELIDHPMAAKGLMRIEKDGSYIYRTKPAEYNQSSAFRIGVMQPPNIQSADGQTDFKTMYTQDDIPIFMFDYEWQPFTGFGKLGVQAGVGFFTTQGNGRFLDGTEAKERYTFYAFPISLGAVYRLEFADRQWLAPYVAGGGTYFALVEMRDDDASPHGVGTPAAYGAGGLMFNVSAFDRETAFTLSSEYGISNLWVSFEYRYVKTFTEDIDLSSGMLNFGLAVDY